MKIQNDRGEEWDESSVADMLDYCSLLPAEARDGWLRELEARNERCASQVRELLRFTDNHDWIDGRASSLSLQLDAANDILEPIPTGVIPGYVFLHKLGEGSYGVVWEAVGDDGQPVAIKLLRVGKLTDIARARFNAEQAIMARLKHPGIAAVIASGSASDGTPYIVMELVHGAQIAVFCEIHQVSLEARVRLIQSVLAALGTAHRAGIVHRDLKPENLLVFGEAELPQAKIIDFGLAKSSEHAIDPKLTASDQLLGTLRYMSPEQIDFGAKRLTLLSDLYSMGVITYELLVGHSPYEENELAVAPSDVIRHREPLPIGSHVPDAIRDVLLRCLRKDPSQRYQSADEFAAALGLAVTGRRVEPRLAGLKYRTGRFLQSRFRSISVVTGLTAALGITVIWLGVSNQRERSWRESSSSLAYARMLDAASSAISEGNQLLARGILASVPPGSRGPEWAWLHPDTAVAQQIATLEGPVIGVVPYQGDGIIASVDGTVAALRFDGTKRWTHQSIGRRVIALSEPWNAGPRHRLWVVLSGGMMLQLDCDTGEVVSEVSGPARAYDITVSRDGTAYIASKRDVIEVTPDGQSRQIVTSGEIVNALAWLDERNWLLVATRDGEVNAGPIVNGVFSPAWCVKMPGAGAIRLALRRQDGVDLSEVIALGAAGEIWFLNATQGSLTRPVLMLGGETWRLAVARDRQIAIGMMDGAVYVVDTDIGTNLSPIRLASNRAIPCWLRNDAMLVADTDGPVHAMSIPSKEQSTVLSLPLAGLHMDTNSRTLRYVVLGSRQGAREIPERSEVTVQQLSSPVTSTFAAADGFLIALRDGQVVDENGTSLLAPTGDPVTQLCVVAQRSVWSSSPDGLILVRSLDDPFRVKAASLPAHVNQVPIAGFVPVGQSVVVAQVDGTVIQFADPNSATVLFSVARSLASVGNTQEVVSLVAADQQTVILWSPDQGVTTIPLPSLVTTPPVGMEQSDRIVVGFANGAVSVLRQGSTTPLAHINLSDAAIAGVNVSSDGTLHAVDVRGRWFVRRPFPATIERH